MENRAKILITLSSICLMVGLFMIGIGIQERENLEVVHEPIAEEVMIENVTFRTYGSPIIHDGWPFIIAGIIFIVVMILVMIAAGETER